MSRSIGRVSSSSQSGYKLQLEEQTKQSKRLVRAGQKENDDCKRLLDLMDIPVVNAPCEAEVQASALCDAGVVWAVGTEDMDALTFR